MAKKKEKSFVILIVGDKPRAMCNKVEEQYYVDVFKATEVVNGKFSLSFTEGMWNSNVHGIFTADDGRQFIVYVDWSVNRIEDCDKNGYPKNTEQSAPQNPPEEHEPVDEATMQAIRIDVKSKVGQTIQTGWGPSLVVGIVQDEDGRELVHLKEFGEENYTVDLREWYETINP